MSPKGPLDLRVRPVDLLNWVLLSPGCKDYHKPDILV